MAYKLIIVWITGEKEEFYYRSRKKAETARDGYYKAFGNQISYAAIQ